MQNTMATLHEEQVVVLSQVLVAEINVGYEDIVNSQVRILPCIYELFNHY